MKIKAVITSVSGGGSRLDVKAMGHELTAAEGEWATPIEFSCKAERGREKSFHVGRELTIEITAEAE